MSGIVSGCRLNDSYCLNLNFVLNSSSKLACDIELIFNTGSFDAVTRMGI